MSIFKNFRKSSVYITPNFPSTITKRYKFKLGRVIFIILLYSIFVSIVAATVLALTPAKKLLFLVENDELQLQAERIEELERKVVFLSNELQKMASSNNKLKYAVMLATIDSLDSTSAVYDSLRQAEPNQMPPPEGNIYRVFKKIYDDLFEEDEKDTDSTVFFIKPLSGVITSPFNPDKGHMGIDYGTRQGSPVCASMGGYVVFAGYTANDGHSIIINHDNGFISKYKHCSVLLKKEREYAAQGEVIALSGNSGHNTTGPHLHFEVWHNNKPVNPEEIIIVNKK